MRPAPAIAGGAPETISPVPTSTAGLRYMAVGAFWFSVMSLLVKVAGTRLPSEQIVLARAVVTLVLSWAMVRRAGAPLWGKAKGRLALRGLVGAVALSCFYFSLVHIPIAEATVIQYMNPVFTAVLAGLVLGERMGRREVACVLLSLVGVVLVTHPAALFGGQARLNPLYVGIAVAGAVCSAGAYTTIRTLRDEHPLTIVFYLPLLTIPVTIPLLVLGSGPRWPTPLEWLVLLGVGAATQIAQVYMTRGLQMERAGRATAVGYLQIVFAAAWGALFFGEFPDAWSVAGALLIVGSTLVLFRSGRPKPAEAAVPEE
ncbi:MAG TPA: DMT family transporter [Longimicrobiaceae bacterium]|nr:DMT family transporter [Longimicrobiaceae bacterium]